MLFETHDEDAERAIEVAERGAPCVFVGSAATRSTASSAARAIKRAAIRALALAALVALIAGPSAAQQDRTRRVRFARGRTSTVIKDAVVRGTVDSYVLGARAGQTLAVHITSLEKNAVFDVVRADGEPFPGASELVDWDGELPADGDYVIEVSGTRGNATYTLKVSIR